MFCRAMEIGLLGSRIAYALKEPYLLAIDSRVHHFMLTCPCNLHYNTPMQYSVIFHGCNKDNFHLKKCDYFLRLT